MSDLAQGHRLAQGRIGVATVARMMRAWPLLDVDDLDASFGSWLAAVESIIRSQRSASATLAASYYAAARRQAVVGAFTPRLVTDIESGRIATSMLVTGPAAIRAGLARGVALDRAVDVGQSRSASSAMRLALDGGRQTILQSVRSDPRSKGFERITSGNACSFCESLAGQVFSEASADFRGP